MNLYCARYSPKASILLEICAFKLVIALMFILSATSSLFVNFYPEHCIRRGLVLRSDPPLDIESTYI